MSDDSPPKRPTHPRYETLEEIGRGGMGVVYRVMDLDLNRVLAMKVLSNTRKASSADAQTDYYARFLEEVQVTAQLDHPAIVPVHDLGFQDDGTPYYTMRFVNGRHLGDIIELAQAKKEGWTLARLIDVLVKVCQALAHAHAKGVLHRDLKPANIMVGDLGEVYVMDWGLARMLGHEDLRDIRIMLGNEDPLETVGNVRDGDAATSLDAPLLTMDGGVVGTPAYMPPEQAEGRIDDLDPASDVYALGAILYQMLAGHPPYMPAHSSVTAREVLTELRNRPPERVRRLEVKLPPELVAICEKAMAREQGDRYQSALELSEELQAFLDGRVVRAHQTGALVELKKWVFRNRVVAVLGGVSLLGLTLFTGLLLVSNYELGRTTVQLEDSLQEEAQANEQAIHRLAAMYTSQGMSTDNPSRAALWFSAAANLQEKEPDALLASRTRLRTWLDEAYTPVRAFRMRDSWRDGNIRGMVFHPELPLLIVETPEQAAVWDLRGQEKPLLPNESFTAAAWNPVTGMLATATTDGQLTLRESPHFDVTREIALPKGPVTRLHFSTDGRMLGIATDALRLWDLESARWLGPDRPHDAPIHWITFDAASEHVATSSGSEARVYEVHSDSEAPRCPPFPHYRWLSHFMRPFEPSFDEQGQLWTNTGEHAAWEDALRERSYRLRRWDILSGKEVASLAIHPQTWHPGAGWLFSSQGVFDLDGNERVALSGERYAKRGVFHPDGGSLLGWKDFGSVTSLPQGTTEATVGEGFHDGAAVRALAYAPHGRYVAVALLRDLEQPEVLVFRSWQKPTFATMEASPFVHTLVLSPCGENAAILSEETDPQVIDARTLMPLAESFDGGGTVLAGAFIDEAHLLLGTGLPSEHRAADSYASGWLQLWDWKRGQPSSSRLTLPSEPRHLAVSPDKTWCAVLCAGRELVHVEASVQSATILSKSSDAKHRLQLPARAMDEFVLTFLDDGTLIYAGDANAHHVWTPEAIRSRGEPLIIPRNRTLTYKREASGKTLFISDRVKHTLSLFDTQTWQARSSNIIAASGITALAWDPIDDHLFTGTTAGFAKIWASPDGPITTLLAQREHPTQVGNAVFVPGTSWVYTCAVEDSLQVWDRFSGRLVAPLTKYLGHDQAQMLLACQGERLLVNRAPDTLSIDLTRLQPNNALSRDEEHQLAEINAHGTIGPEGTYQRLPRREWFERWHRFRQEHPHFHDPVIAPSPQELIRWHREMALDPNRQRFGKRWHLRQWLSLEDSSEAKALLKEL